VKDIGQDELYNRLSILDSKCSALLQLSSVVLALNVIPATTGDLSGLTLAFSIIVAVGFLLVAFLSLSVIWIEWEPTVKTLSGRTCRYRAAFLLTWLGLLSMLILTILALS